MKKVIITISIIISILIIIVVSLYSVLGEINRVDIDKSDEALGINTEVETKDLVKIEDKKIIAPAKERDDVVNIVLFGLDRREPNESSRSDSIIIMTVDFKNKKIKLSSFMRDMYVSIEGYGNTKLGHAYAYGGATLAIKTINQNFGTNIRDYVSVDFSALEKIIDLIGGVNINIKQEEIIKINKSSSGEDITQCGNQLLNGSQAVAYSRIRYIGNGDFERTERQRRVLLEILRKTKEAEIASVLVLASEILPLV